ncbi:inactive glutathione S-transferase D3-like isoform X1 [Phlebotomus papatasi]|uniref:inactive glutathione S-transferase D3-like isoform X1 n=1 Tax=Phlebotomus papatasi TaxID=29031 RepID=UPI002483FACB|nr:inactive glutathione S-transferase D3-like isoform X1 [Phlebotomus papatasi]
MAPVKLYYFPLSPPSRAVYLTVQNLKLDVEKTVIDTTKKEQLAPEFVKINPQHTVPTIDDNGFILWESRAIVSYLVSAKAPGSSLYPSDIKKKAIVDARLFLDQDLWAATSAIILSIYAHGATTVAEDKKEKVYKILGNLNTFMEGQNYVAGNDLTVADLALLANISTLYEIGANVNKFKNIAAWYKRLETIPGYQENLEGAKGIGNFLRAKMTLKGTWDD